MRGNRAQERLDLFEAQIAVVILAIVAMHVILVVTLVVGFAD